MHIAVSHGVVHVCMYVCEPGRTLTRSGDGEWVGEEALQTVVARVGSGPRGERDLCFDLLLRPYTAAMLVLGHER
jgi:hypothetical protein